ncbi:hypothetical protein HJG60_011836 [Phyllostomus discolor]|uniref:Uncharacterized protein n=1 Tax=Phyllostomus discolor TaxID=89673 RepID=A0A833ZL86_9CHIR|nr:hypothetical protein HJG60_011836 [Phyllostomus discolor]
MFEEAQETPPGAGTLPPKFSVQKVQDPVGSLQALSFLGSKRSGRGSPTHWRSCLRPLRWGLLYHVIQKIQTALFHKSEIFCFLYYPSQIHPWESTSSRTPSFSEEDRNCSILYRGHGNYIEQTTLSSRWVQPCPLTNLNLNLRAISQDWAHANWSSRTRVKIRSPVTHVAALVGAPRYTKITVQSLVRTRARSNQ